MRALGLRILTWLLPVALLGSCSIPVAQAVTLPHHYTIGGRSYYEESIKAAQYIPGLPVEIKDTLRLLSNCPNLSVNVFVSFSQVSGGVVAYAPNSLLNCRSVVGGGPGGGPSGFSPCYSFFHTTNTTFPYAVVAGTSTQTCIDLAFEVPGGILVTLNTNRGPAQFVVKAQHYENGNLIDYLASPASVPSSRSTFALYDSRLGVGRRSVIPLF
jgi:hypothetical protein